MTILRLKSLSTRYLLVLFTSSALIAVSGVLSLIVIDYIKLKESLIENTRYTANFLNQDLVQLLVTGDVELASDLTSRLEMINNIITVTLYNLDNHAIYNYRRTSKAKTDGSRPTEIKNGTLAITHRVAYQGKAFGTVSLRVSTQRHDELISDKYKVLAVLLLLITLVSFLSSRKIQSFVTKPIVNLSKAMREIRNSQDLAMRVKNTKGIRRDELGELYNSFNALLNELEKSRQELDASKTKTDTILEMVGSAIISVDENQSIILFNSRAQEVFGYMRDEVVGKNLNVLIPEENREKHRQHIRGFGDGITKMSGARGVDIFALHKTGRKFPIDASISKIVLNDKPIYTVALDDITWREEAKNKLEQNQEDLERMVSKRTHELEISNQELERYSYTIAHDLRAPLRAIISFSQIVLEGAGNKLDGEQYSSLERVVAAGKRMSVLIEHILSLSRLSRKEPRRVILELNEKIHTIISGLSATDPDRKINWIVQEHLVANVDPDLIEIVLLNLLDNAWKFTSGNDSAEIEFGMIHSEDKDVFFVKDNGMGFDMAYKDKLFHEFQKLHSGKNIQGEGIGLASVGRIVQRHGGRIWAESSPDQGATFYFTLK